ncbi:hypothetical protein ACOI1H_03795 [Loktanella sp. DJP18]|uniref:hypothetical protein n=1 Tax=Loktanella sp. DJP18 TaxID=3409788 RepID=UPI003BB6FD68
MLKFLLIPMALLATPALADVCASTVESIDLQIDTETLTVSPAPTTRRERLLNFPARSFDWVTGHQRTCTSEEVFALLSQIEPVDDMCLQYADDDAGYLLVPGPRNFRGRCSSGGICTKVNGTKDALTSATGAIVGTILGTGTSTLSKVTHSSGAVVLSGTGASVGSTLGTAATGAVTAVGAPVAIGAAAVTAVAVGGAVYVCSE